MPPRFLALVCSLPALLLIVATSGTVFEAVDYFIARSIDGLLEHLGSVPAHWGASHLTLLLLIATAFAAPKMAFVGFKTYQAVRQVEREMVAGEALPSRRP